MSLQLVELDEGVRMASRLLELRPYRRCPGSILPVELVFRELGDGFRLPCFQPSEQLAP
jgi:hypothetical protein